MHNSCGIHNQRVMNNKESNLNFETPTVEPFELYSKLLFHFTATIITEN